MIIVRLSGGLGNQLFQYFSALGLAQELGCSLKCDISSFQLMSSHSGFVLPRLLNNIELATNDEIVSLKGGATRLSKVLRRLGYYSCFYRQDNHRQTLCTRQFPLYLEGYWQNPRNWESRGLSVDSSRLVTSLRESTLNRPQQARTVGVHVRRGDYLNVSHLNIVTKEYYFKALKQYMNDDYLIKIFSDDTEWVSEVFRGLDNVQIIARSEDEIENWIDLSKCDDFIIPNSTFSWWAAYLGAAVDKKVILPDMWTLEYPSDYWIPSSQKGQWQKLGG